MKIPHPSVQVAAFNKEFETVETVGQWILYFTGFAITNAGTLSGSWIASRPTTDETNLVHHCEPVSTVFGRPIFAEHLLTRQGRHELKHRVIDMKDKMKAEMARIESCL